MKPRTILIYAFAALTMAGVTSCEDILKVESKTVMYDYQNTLDQPTDTVYTVLGIIKQMQKVADRSVILGEVRGDLVKLSDHASDDLREIYSYDFGNVKKTNKYDQALDYYAIINNCNFFLKNADINLVRDGENVFLKEYIVVLCYRAWAYLQLAQAYGKVPFFDEPITGDVTWKDEDKMDIRELAKVLLADFKDEYMDYEQPDYGTLGGETTGEGTSAAQHATKDLFIPVRLIMGDLYLWAEDYPHAALCYLDFLTKIGKTYTTGTNSAMWRSNDFLFGPSSTYSSLFSNNGYICYIPMEADQFSGITSDLVNIFNTTLDNDYWYQLTRSQAATAISVRQDYCYHNQYSSSNYTQWATYMDKAEEKVLLRRGDLRLQDVLDTRSRVVADDEINTSKLGTESQTLNKINSEKIWLYRKDVIYLRLAEALNRCELPQTAFAILKTGLCDANIDSLEITQGTFIGEELRSVNVKAPNGTTVDISSVYTKWEQAYFRPAVATWTETNLGGSTTGASSKYMVFAWGPKSNVGNTMGIHSRGCGDANYDPNYRIPVDTTGGRIPSLQDSIRAVEEMLIDEMALETCFEGYRFGDLMRIAMHRAKDNGDMKAFAENEFLAKRVAVRDKASLNDDEDYYKNLDDDDDLYKLLLGADDHAFNKNWFLVLPDEKQANE